MPKALDNTDEILALYESGISSLELSQRFNINRTSIPKMYKRKYKIKSMLPNQGNIRYFQNIDTKMKAYLLGFIAADGCITNNNCLKINIIEKDRIILDTLKSQIGCENKISIVNKNNGQQQVSFNLSNDMLKLDLNNLGIVSNKSLTMPNIIQNIPKEFRPSFILGYLDGDGWVSNSLVKSNPKYKEKQYDYKPHIICHVGFCGTKEFLLGITDEINPSIFRIRLNKSIHNLDLSSSKQEIIRYYHYLYDSQPFYLQRKHDKFIEYFNTINYTPIQ